MKELYKILFIALLFSGCDNFLSPAPQGKLTEEVFFSEEEGALMGVNAIYSRLREWDQVGFSWFAICELPSDNSNTGSELSDGSVARLNTVNNFTYNAGVDELNGWWTGNYNAIASCNVALASLNGLENEALKSTLYGTGPFFPGIFLFQFSKGIWWSTFSDECTPTRGI